MVKNCTRPFRTLETREKAPSPKFVVSLDGIDPDMMEKFEDRMDEDLEGEYEIGIEGIRREEPMETGHPGQKGRNIVKVRPMQLMGQTGGQNMLPLTDIFPTPPTLLQLDCHTTRTAVRRL